MTRNLPPWLAGLVLLLAACGLGDSPPMTVALTLRPTATLTPAPRPSPTRTPIIIPTATVTPSPTPPTPRTPTLNATLATLAALDPTEMVATLVAAVRPRVLTSHLSPDGQWRAEVVIYDCTQVFGIPDENSYEQFRLIQVSTGTALEIDSQYIYCGGLGAYGLEGLFWSPNSRYFYYTDARAGLPDGCNFGWERSIIGFDVTSLAVGFFGSGPLSPDGYWMATWQGPNMVIWALDGGVVAYTQAVAPGALQGRIAWSPDGQALVYVQYDSDCPLSGKSYVVRLELPELNQTRLIESEAPTFGGVRWDTPDQLTLFDEQGKEWRYSFTTQELMPVP